MALFPGRAVASFGVLTLRSCGRRGSVFRTGEFVNKLVRNERKHEQDKNGKKKTKLGVLQLFHETASPLFASLRIDRRLWKDRALN